MLFFSFKLCHKYDAMAIQILHLDALGRCFQADSGCWQNFVTKHAGYIIGEQ